MNAGGILDLVNHKNVQSQLKLKSADNAVVKLRSPPPNVIMTLIFPQSRTLDNPP